MYICNYMYMVSKVWKERGFIHLHVVSQNTNPCPLPLLAKQSLNETIMTFQSGFPYPQTFRSSFLGRWLSQHVGTVASAVHCSALNRPRCEGHDRCLGRRGPSRTQVLSTQVEVPESYCQELFPIWRPAPNIRNNQNMIPDHPWVFQCFYMFFRDWDPSVNSVNHGSHQKKPFASRRLSLRREAQTKVFNC